MTTESLPTPALALDCEGYRKLLAAVEKDEALASGSHDYRGKLAWVLARARQYAERTGLTPESILDAWEQARTYWYMNYYQEAHQPVIADGKVRVFETVADLRDSIGTDGFRCPRCAGISKDPFTCDSGVEVDGKTCDWKVYGLLGHLGKGIAVFVKEKLRGESIFMPVAWERDRLTIAMLPSDMSAAALEAGAVEEEVG